MVIKIFSKQQAIFLLLCSLVLCSLVINLWYGFLYFYNHPRKLCGRSETMKSLFGVGGDPAQVPLGLPCYDLTPVMNHTVVSDPLAVSLPTSDTALRVGGMLRCGRTSRPWGAGWASPGRVLAGKIGNSSNGCCMRSGVRSRSACGWGKPDGWRLAMSGSTGTFATTSTTAVFCISTYAARKSGRNVTVARRGRAQSPIGCRSSSVRRWWRKETASAIGSWIRCMGKTIPPSC